MYFLPEETSKAPREAWEFFCKSTENGSVKPNTITYKKEESGFFRITDYNRETDAQIMLKNREKVKL